ncbi:MAG TPA: cyclase family protein, partial [Aggregatilineales bacterium]|nr:cyclase family protein [Aggregatilineales bacterium]
MKIYDITVPITDTMPTWENRDRVEMHFTSHQNQGNTATVTRMSLSVHTGTHLDAPLHFIRGG